MGGWLYDYRITPSGLTIVLFGVVTVYTLAPSSIVSVRVIRGLWGGLDFGSHSFNTVSLGNRLRLTWVLVEKRRGMRFLALTPKDPGRFVGDLSRQMAS